MSGVGYLTEERDWSRALDEAKSLETLRTSVAGWAPYVDDAQSVVNGMGEQDFERWRDGLKIERKGRFAGEEFARKFGALLMPAKLMQASLVSMHFKVPLGCALIRIAETKK